MTTEAHTWRKVEPGFYELEGTPFSVASSHTDDGDTDSSTPEWALIRGTKVGGDPQDGENIDWFPTMREAREAAERMV